MVSTTIHNLPSDGTMIARGTSSAADGDAINTGLPSVSGFIANSASADTVITNRTSSGPNVTVGVFAAGTASGGTKTIYWEAWSIKKV